MNRIAPALQVEHLGVRYREVTALVDTSLTLEPGRVCGLVGMNGSGKSTLFKSIMGVVRPRIHPHFRRTAGEGAQGCSGELCAPERNRGLDVPHQRS